MGLLEEGSNSFTYNPRQAKEANPRHGYLRGRGARLGKGRGTIIGQRLMTTGLFRATVAIVQG